VGVLGSRSVLCRRHPDPLAVAGARVSVGHVQDGPLGPSHNRTDFKASALLDHRADRKTEEVFALLLLQNPGDGGGSFHRGGERSGSAMISGSRRTDRQPSGRTDSRRQEALVRGGEPHDAGPACGDRGCAASWVSWIGPGPRMPGWVGTCWKCWRRWAGNLSSTDTLSWARKHAEEQVARLLEQKARLEEENRKLHETLRQAQEAGT